MTALAPTSILRGGRERFRRSRTDPARRLVELVAELHPDRHGAVTETIRSLIGDS